MNDEMQGASPTRARAVTLPRWRRGPGMPSSARVAVLTDPGRAPDEAQVREHLGSSFAAWTRLEVALTGPELGLQLTWHHFRDGGWLREALRGRKDVAWLAVWEGYATLTCYLSARHRDDLVALPLPRRSPDAGPGSRDVRGDAAGRRGDPLRCRRRRCARGGAVQAPCPLTGQPVARCRAAARAR